MKTLFIVILFSSNALALSNFFNDQKCTEEVTKKEPFMVTDANGMGWKSYENFRSKDNYRKKENIIPRRSIVRIKKGSEEYAASPDSYIPVEVIGVADTDFHDMKLAQSRLKSASAFHKYQKLAKTNLGRKGFIYNKSLKKADEYTYVLKEDSPILDDNGLSGMGIVALKPVKSKTGEYIMDKCCKQNDYSISYFPQNSEPVKCTTNYRFKLIYADKTEGQEINIDVNACNIADSLIPFQNKDISAMMNFLTLANKSETNFNTSKLEFIDERGLVKIPVDYDKTDGQGVMGPFSSYHYTLDDKGASDIYAKPLTSCVFMKVLAEQEKSCQGAGCQIQFGDIFHEDEWGAHKEHDSGECIDIRPMKKSDSKTAITYGHSNYDREKTKNFINLLFKAGATKIIFDDPKVKNTLKTNNNSHNNHIHVCFDPKSKAVQKTCYQGLKK